MYHRECPIDSTQRFKARGQNHQAVGYIELRQPLAWRSSTWTSLVLAQPNLMMAATLMVWQWLKMLREPEIVDLAIFLRNGSQVKELVRNNHRDVLRNSMVRPTMWYRTVSKLEPLWWLQLWQVAMSLFWWCSLGTQSPLDFKTLLSGIEVTEESEGIRVRSQFENLKAVHVKTCYIQDFQQICRHNLQPDDSCKRESPWWKRCLNRFQHLEEMRGMGIQRLSVIQLVL